MKIVIFGAGENVKHIIFNLKNARTRFGTKDVAYLVDNKKYDIEYEYIDGTKYNVYFPTKILDDKEEKLIIISSINCYYQISTQLSEFGLLEGKDYIGWGGLIQADWVTMQNLLPSMEYRVQYLARMLSCDITSVVDLGCGNMDMKKYIRSNIKYIPVDYFTHDQDTVVCDLDSKQYPDIEADAMVLGAILEHISNYEELVEWVCNHTKKEVVLAYTPIEYLSDINIRKTHGCKNHMSVDEMVNLFEINNMRLVEAKIMHTIERPAYKFRINGE